MAKEIERCKKFHYILVELAHHLPFSIFGVTSGLVAMGVLTFFSILLRADSLLPEASELLFHIFHPAHILFSAVASTAMFWKHEKNILKAILVGFFSSILICGLSDAIIPFFGGLILNQPMHIHICLIEEPNLILPFAIVGVLAGLFVTNSLEKSTEYSHAAHVFISSAASILYLISFGMVNWAHLVGGVFIVTIIAVMIPCCASDIALPISCSHVNCNHD